MFYTHIRTKPSYTLRVRPDNRRQMSADGRHWYDKQKFDRLMMISAISEWNSSLRNRENALRTIIATKKIFLTGFEPPTVRFPDGRVATAPQRPYQQFICFTTFLSDAVHVFVVYWLYIIGKSNLTTPGADCFQAFYLDFHAFYRVTDRYFTCFQAF